MNEYIDVVVHGSVDRSRFENVASSDRATVTFDEPLARVVSGQTDHVVSLVGEPIDESIPQNAGSAGDEYLHRTLAPIHTAVSLLLKYRGGFKRAGV